MPADGDARKLRLFVAVWPDAGARDALLAWRGRWQWPAATAPTPPERLHLTLHFLGAVAAARLPEIVAGLAVPWPPFDVDFDRAGVWPGGIAVLGATAVPPALAALHAGLGAAIARLGLPVEPRPYRPHVTLARHAVGALPPPEAPRLRWHAAGYALVESDAGYRTLARWPAA